MTAQESTGLEIMGNVKTKAWYVRLLFENCMASGEEEGQPAGDISNLTQCMMNARLFSKVSVEKSDSGIWQVQVQEKMTLIPLPLFQADGGNARKTGLIVVESNLFGLGKMLAAGGFVSKNGNSYFLTLRDPSVMLSNWMVSFSVSRARQQLVLQEMEEKTDAFHESLLAFSGSLGYRFDSLRLVFFTRHQQKTFACTGKPLKVKTEVF